MTGGRGCVVCRENIAAERSGHNDEHQEFGIILHWLEDDEFAFDKGETVLTNVVAVRGVKGSNFRASEFGFGGQSCQ